MESPADYLTESGQDASLRVYRIPILGFRVQGFRASGLGVCTRAAGFGRLGRQHLSYVDAATAPKDLVPYYGLGPQRASDII